MTPEVQGQIVDSFYDLLWIIIPALIIAAVLGIIYKKLMKKAEQFGKERQMKKLDKDEKISQDIERKK